MYTHRILTTVLLTLSLSIMSCNPLGDDSPAPDTSEKDTSSDTRESSQSSDLPMSHDESSGITKATPIESSSVSADDSVDASSVYGESSDEGITDESSFVNESSSSQADASSETGLSSSIDLSCKEGQLCDPELEYAEYTPTGSELVIPRSDYLDRIHGMWLGECIANWTGIVTEMDHTEAPFYVESDWGIVDPINMFETWDQENIPFYNDGKPPMIDYVYQYGSDPWASDDDTDIEYIYQHLLDKNNSSILTGDQIRDGWLSHIDGSYVWVSNENAYNLMKSGVVPPETSDPSKNWGYEQIDAQLTTEIFGMFSPANPAVALKMSHLPILTTARYNAQWISEFYVIMYSLAAYVEYHPDHAGSSMHDKLKWMADKAAERLPSESFSNDMYAFVKSRYEADSENWEATRDALYERYQLGWGNVPNYTYAGRAEAGINFAAGLISLFYGNGDIKRTIKVGALCGWDSDNPTATWGGLFGFMLGKEAVVEAFGEGDLSETYNILRTRVALPDYTPGVAGQDSFPLLAKRGISIIDRAIIEEMGGGVDLENDLWYIPEFNGVIEEGASHY